MLGTKFKFGHWLEKTTFVAYCCIFSKTRCGCFENDHNQLCFFFQRPHLVLSNVQQSQLVVSFFSFDHNRMREFYCMYNCTQRSTTTRQIIFSMFKIKNSEIKGFYSLNLSTITRDCIKIKIYK